MKAGEFSKLRRKSGASRFLAGVGYISTVQMYPTQAKLEWATLKASFSAACKAPAVLEIAHSLSKRQLPRQLDILEGFGDQCSRSVGSCGQRSRAGRLPRGAAIFPLVIGELLYVGTVVAHDEDLAVGLRRAGIDRFVLKAHARAAEEQLLSVGGPSEMRLVTTRMSELCQTGAVRMDGHHLEVPVDPADESDQVGVR